MSTFKKPIIPALPLADIDGINLGSYLVQEKSDGCHVFLSWRGHVLNAERMPDGSHVVNDIVDLWGDEIATATTSVRWHELRSLAREFEPGMRLSRVLTDAGGIAGEIAAGGEGAVIKDLGAPFGVGWLKIKRAQNFICRVACLDHACGSATLVDAATGQARGRLALRNRFDQVAGMFTRGENFALKVVAFGAHKSGLLREARLDTDTATSWLVNM